ncbi:undecaprenyl-diphosphate phosphatase [Buchnera aphidicola]|uniref:undecaprenyl-diphosphate phosphatase n=1 Tax=Buchnera aphidicola TaxID=9 RepID=UPI0001ECFD4A|nr:undecaprenyl-diphosphate phosphatase [Buchnera aphidicola]ADP67039.1 undecaprenyl pyrophosphate phosphatase [Buchnera aphidicola str. JF99 (Acyrthosiphon pisum)]ADP67617.1 undecaprenyl pyrophosphate phosphatase [Buchnera aphidicola str. JF98 (Acyrthosiphon pisum)]
MLDLHQIIVSIIIGVIEGITEFLPISSTGHMIIASHWLKIDNENTKILEIFIEFGSALSILYFFHKKILRILKFNINVKKTNTKNLHILLAILPTIFFGLLFYKKIKLLFNTYNVMYALILGGIFLLISEIFKPKKYKTCSINDISLLQSAIIGFFQIFCLYPGFSRSGATIGTAILLGIKRSVAIEFSFIISIPLIMGASFYDFINNMHNFKILDLPIFFIGFMISFIVSILCIKKLLKIINRTSLIFFGIYRFIISGLIYFIN